MITLGQEKIDQIVKDFNRWRWFHKQGKAYWQFKDYGCTRRTRLYLEKQPNEDFPLKMGSLFIRRNWIEKL